VGKKKGPRLPRLPRGAWLKEYPFRPNYFERPGGYYLHYLDEGRGEPVLLVHGNPGWSFMYRDLIKTLASDYRCLALDHLGMGLSSRPLARTYGFRLTDRINDLSAWIDSLELPGPVHLVAHDWGGPIGLGWAGANPSRLASLTLMNTGLGLPQGYALSPKLGLFRRTGFLGRFLAHRLNLFLNGLTRYGSVRPLPPTVIEGWLAPYRFSFLREAIGRFVEDIPLSPRHPSWGALGSVERSFGGLAEVPTFLVWGLADFVFTPVFLADWRARRPNAQVLALPRAGHLLLEDEPEKIIPAIRQFLRQTQRLGRAEVHDGPGQ
jgi:haloalkane dehalogenase